MTMSNTGTRIQLKVHYMGLGYQCECPDLEGIVGIAKHPADAIHDFLKRWEERFNETPKYKWS
jgi:hypothetical protein